MREYFANLFQNASLGDFLTIFGIIGSITLSIITLVYKRKHKYVEIKKAYLNKINVAYNLFQDCNAMIYDVNRYADIVSYIKKIDLSIIDIKHYHSDNSEELAAFDQEYIELTSTWERVLNSQWQQLCDPKKGDAYINGERNWNSFSVRYFWNFYDKVKPVLYSLRAHVRNSI